jgi:putative restriction endonuclease
VKLYYHHVGQEGSSDFDKTVFKELDVSILNDALDPSIRDETISKMKLLFPTGLFNCWGVPALANIVIKNLTAGDYVLLVQSTRIDGVIPALCYVKYFLPGQQPLLSEVLWGKNKYPYIFFFDTERLHLPWIDFLDHLEYAQNFDPRGKFYSVADERLSEFGGVENYISFLREHYSSGKNAFATISADELQEEERIGERDRKDALKLNRDIVNSETSHLYQITLEGGDDPALTQDTKLNTHTSKERDAAFSMNVKRLYGLKCAVCYTGAKGPKGETEVESAHFYPKSKDGSDNLRNGFCLCRKHHWAFDVGWFALSDEYRVIVRDDIPNEPDYEFILKWAGKRVRFPEDETYKPHLNFVRAHRQLMNFE